VSLIQFIDRKIASFYLVTSVDTNTAIFRRGLQQLKGSFKVIQGHQRPRDSLEVIRFPNCCPLQRIVTSIVTVSQHDDLVAKNRDIFYTGAVNRYSVLY